MQAFDRTAVDNPRRPGTPDSAAKARLRAADWEVRPVPVNTAQQMIAILHYAGRGANTGTYIHGLYPKGQMMDWPCYGVAWWLPPLPGAAASALPENPRGVLVLSRMVVSPAAPFNAASFLLAASMRLIDRDRWPALLTFADTWQGHTGAIYRATNWLYCGLTQPSERWILGGKLISSKKKTHAQMAQLGATLAGYFPMHKFLHLAG